MYGETISTAPADPLIIFAFILLTGLYWAGLRLIQQECINSCQSPWWGVFTTFGCCYITALFILLLVIGKFLWPDSSHNDIAYTLMTYLSAILILMVWGFIQYTYLHQPYSDYLLLKQEDDLRIEIRGLRRSGATVSDEQINEMRIEKARDLEGSFKNKCVYYSNTIGNIILGLAFTAFEAVMLGGVVTNRNSQNWELAGAEMFISIFILIIMVIFIPLSKSQISQDNKQFCTTAFITFIPLTVIAGVYRGVVEDPALVRLLKTMIVAVPCAGVYLATLNYANKKGTNIYRAYLTISGLGFVFPGAISGTLYFIELYDLTSIYVMPGIIVFAVCTMIIVVFLVVYAIMKWFENSKYNYEFHESNFNSLGGLINASGGIIGFSFLTYTYSTCPESESFQRGSLYAFAFFILFISICINIILRIKIPEGVTSHSLEFLFSEREDPNAELYYWEGLWQRIAIIGGIVLLPVLMFILYFFSPNQADKTFFLMTMVGVFAIACLLIVILELRKKIGAYSKNCLPLCTSCFWIFVILPLLVGAPVAIYYLGTDPSHTSNEDYAKVAEFLISFVCIICMIGVTVCAIIINYVFKQMEIERKAKFTMKYMKAILSKIAVRSSDDLLRLLYDNYTRYSEQVLVDALTQGSVVFWWPIPDRDPDPKHNRQLLDSEQYKKLKEIADATATKAKDIPIEKQKKEEKRDEKAERCCCEVCYESDF